MTPLSTVREAFQDDETLCDWLVGKTVNYWSAVFPYSRYVVDLRPAVVGDRIEFYCIDDTGTCRPIHRNDALHGEVVVKVDLINLLEG